MKKNLFSIRNSFTILCIIFYAGYLNAQSGKQNLISLTKSAALTTPSNYGKTSVLNINNNGTENERSTSDGIVNTLSAPDDSGVGLTATFGYWAQGFTIGDADITLTSVTIQGGSSDPAVGSTVQIEIRDDKFQDAGNLIETLGNVSTNGSSYFATENMTINSTTNPTLSANTTYYVLVYYVSGADFGWDMSLTPTNTGTGASLSGVSNSSLLGELIQSYMDFAINYTPPANFAPTATGVYFSGDLVENQTVNGFYTYSDEENDPESGTTYKWYRSDDNTGTNKTEINSATSTSYVLTSDDVGKYISFEVTPNDGTDAGDPVESERLGPISFLNHAPTFTKGGDETVLEDAGAQTVSGWATGMDDGDTETQVLSFNVSNNNNALFAVQPAIDGSTGNLTYTPADNANGSATVSVNLSDDGGTQGGGDDTSADQTFTISVTAINDIPSFTKGADDDGLEDEGAITINSWVVASSAGPDDESGQTLSYNVSNDNNSLFSVQPAVDASGNLTYTTAENANGSATVTISISDDGGTDNGGVNTSADQTFTISLTAVNDVPSFTKGADETILEDSGAQTVSGWATGLNTGPSDESSQILSFNVSNDNNSLFAIQPTLDANGNLSYTPADNANGVTTVSVSISDNGGTTNGGVDTSDDQTFTITINQVNDAPSFTKGANQEVLEDSGVDVAGRANNEVVASGWATNLSNGAGFEDEQTLSFTLSNDNNALFSVQPTVNGSNGDLTYTLAENANGSATVSLFVSDDGGTSNGGQDTSESQSFTITVIPVNDAPNFSSSNDDSILEDAGSQTVSGWATNITAGPEDESEQNLTFNLLSNTNPDLFSVLPSLDHVTGNLTYTTAVDANGKADLIINLSDDGGTENGGENTSVRKFLTIDVTAVNDAPSFTKGSDQVVEEGAGEQIVFGWATAISSGPENENNQSLSFEISTDNSTLFSSLPEIDVTTGDLKYAINPNLFGSAIVTVKIKDNGGTANGGIDTSSEQTFTITVNSVNDIPEFTSSPSEIAIEDAAYNYNVIVSDNDADASLTITASQKPDWLSLTDNGDGTAKLTGTPTNDDVGNHDIVLEVTDGIISEAVIQGFQIEVMNTNDAPILSSSLPSDIEFCPQPESVEIELSDFVTDIDPGDELTYSISFNSMDDVEVELDGSLLIIDHSAKESGAFDITIEVKDKASLSVTADITVNINYFEFQVKNDGNSLRVAGNGDIQWFKDGEAIAGATSASFNASDVGTYKVRVTNGNCFLESGDIEIDALTNIRLKDISESVNIYPNPATSVLNIDSEQSLLGKTEVFIYDIHGKLVINKTLQSNKIDISSLQKGIYILQLIKDESSRAIKKIIKQ